MASAAAAVVDDDDDGHCDEVTRETVSDHGAFSVVAGVGVNASQSIDGGTW